MDNKIKKEASKPDQRRLEIFRKARQNADADARQENEENYNKRVSNMDKK